MPRPRLSFEPDDPLTILMQPPPNETPEQRTARIHEEAEAQRVSDEIDEHIKADRAALKKRKGIIKLLLLGQSESGKSTTLKNIQLSFAPNAWLAERASWRAVIQLNLVCSVNKILDALAVELTTPPKSSISRPGSRPVTSPVPAEPVEDEQEPGDDDDYKLPSPPSSQSSLPPLQFTSNHSLLKLRLAPLHRVEADLKKFLGAGTDEITASSLPGGSGMMATPFDKSSYDLSPPNYRRPAEFTVRSQTSWKSALGQHTKLRPQSPKGQDHGSEFDDVNEVIAGCEEDMKELWQDGVIQELIDRKGIKLGDSAEYFLNNIDRIARRNYEPSDSDVLRARLRTLGVQEHRVVFENGSKSLPPGVDVGKEWIIYDVGGSRTSRSAWLPFFDDAHAIVFLAPISCFDETLAEDPKVNRLRDSFVLWKSIVESKLLTKCAIILFMNKYDLLERKIQSGIKVNQYMTSFGDRENKASVFAKYLKQKFREQMKEYSPKPRQFYAFMTSVIDQRATAATLASVRDNILREHLKQADFV